MPSDNAAEARIAELLFTRFFTGQSQYAVMRANREGQTWYVPGPGAPTLALVQEHLDGVQTLGAYSLDAENLVRWVAWDVDGPADRQQAVRNITLEMVAYLRNLNLAPIVEFSGSKGFHVILFLATPIPANQARQWAISVADALEVSRSTHDPLHVEVFPKQGVITPGGVGNLLKLPLGRHLRTNQFSHFCDANLVEITTTEVIVEMLERTFDLTGVAPVIPSEDPIGALVGVMGPIMVSGNRNNPFFGLCGYLYRMRWEEQDVLTFLNELNSQYGPLDMVNLEGVIERTFRVGAEGRHVGGSLTNLGLTDTEIATITVAAESGSADPTLLGARRIIFGKGESLLKAEDLAQLMVGRLKTLGQLSTDANRYLYWLRRTDGRMFSDKHGGDDWAELLFSLVRWVKSDKVFKLASELIAGDIIQTAPKRLIKRLAYWEDTDKVLYLNLGRHVYILNGNPEERKVVYNGEDLPLLFDNSDLAHPYENLLNSELEPISPWAVLLDDVAFTAYENIKPDQSKELLKAWVLSVFFGSILPTRPLATILAEPGAGKTTLARRIVKFFEGPTADVSAVVEKQDAFRTQLVHHRVMCLDNLEKSGKGWLVDDLNRVATGAVIELRRLYSDSSIVKIVPDVALLLTATKMPFAEETLFSRLLPIPLGRVVDPVAEGQLQTSLMRRLPQAWLGMLDVLDDVITQLQRPDPVPNPSRNRLADFTQFAAQLRDVPSFNGEVLLAALANLSSNQAIVSASHSTVTTLLAQYSTRAADEAGQWRNFIELGTVLGTIPTHPVMPPPAGGWGNELSRIIRLSPSVLEEVEWEHRIGPQGVSQMRYAPAGRRLDAETSSGAIQVGNRRVGIIAPTTRAMPVDITEE